MAYQSDKVSGEQLSPTLNSTLNGTVNGKVITKLNTNLTVNQCRTNTDLTPANTVKVQAAKKYRKVKYIKRYRYVKRYRYGKYRYVRAAYYIKVTVSYYKASGKGTGDCWTNSEILYNSLRAKGYHVRIIQYPTSYSSRHRSVQYLSGGRWVNYNYKGNGYAWRYYYTSNYVNGRVVKSC